MKVAIDYQSIGIVGTGLISLTSSPRCNVSIQFRRWARRGARGEGPARRLRALRGPRRGDKLAGLRRRFQIFRIQPRPPPAPQL
ncbi:hypothetical protein EVAR_41914_1 [Eumeta japonica]|uniref:Uncharacterized protein n=1 Tax=Eumeta variegata TaxID=151549 RepID=A0A4C1XHF4_EUMVA|nr:hypothetical protein EVAR_41914_1 [Eumeta japonica]